MNRVPSFPRLLGLAGLLPQLGCLLAVLIGGEGWRFAGLALAWGYAALIFSFLGGLWWGLAAGAAARGVAVPDWLWAAAVVPSLIAFASFAPWVFAARWPQPALMVLGLGLVLSLLVDRRITDIAPDWWWPLRLPLSLGLMTMALALV